MRHRMIGRQPAIEHAEQLFLQRTALDAVGVQHRGVRRQARPDGRSGMLARPVDDTGQASPSTARPSGFWRAARCRSRSGRRAACPKARKCRGSARPVRAERASARGSSGMANSLSSTTVSGVAARMRSTNCRSVASTAASGMLLTRPTVMQFAAFNSAADPNRAVSRKSGIVCSRRAYSAAISAARGDCAAASA